VRPCPSKKSLVYKAKTYGFLIKKKSVLDVFHEKSKPVPILMGFYRFRSVSCLVLFHCRHLNGNGKFIILCVLCASSEAGGEYKLTYLHSKDRTFNLAENLME
jgi:hypothetical protein